MGNNWHQFWIGACNSVACVASRRQGASTAFAIGFTCSTDQPRQGYRNRPIAVEVPKGARSKWRGAICTGSRCIGRGDKTASGGRDRSPRLRRHFGQQCRYTRDSVWRSRRTKVRWPLRLLCTNRLAMIHRPQHVRYPRTIPGQLI